VPAGWRPPDGRVVDKGDYLDTGTATFELDHSAHYPHRKATHTMSTDGTRTDPRNTAPATPGEAGSRKPGNAQPREPIAPAAGDIAAPAVAGPLVVLVGPPGSGKSTWARRHFPKDQIVSLDGLRRVVSGDPNNQEATPWAVQARNALVRGRIRFGLPTVVDATNADPAQRAEVAKMQFMYQRPVGDGRRLPAIAVIFDTPLDECLARNAVRHGNRRVPDEFVVDCHRAIIRDLPVPSTWIPAGFTTGLRVRPEGTYRMGADLRYLREALPWYATGASLRTCPDWLGM
jgi:predicted kinase